MLWIAGSGGDPKDTAFEGRPAGRHFVKGKRASPASDLADEESSDDTDANTDSKEQGRSKRPRLQWNEELRRRFLNAVNFLVSESLALVGAKFPLFCLSYVLCVFFLKGGDRRGEGGERRGVLLGKGIVWLGRLFRFVWLRCDESGVFFAVCCDLRVA